MGVNVTQVEETMCGSIYKETAAEVHRGHVEESYQDLFMEQGSLSFAVVQSVSFLFLSRRVQTRTHLSPQNNPLFFVCFSS